jgi:hypothetical protein
VTAKAPHISLFRRYLLIWKRRRALWRSFRSRHRLQTVQDRTDKINPGDILCFICLRNEMQRLPWFLDYYRKLGVDHFLAVDNGSDDGSASLLAAQEDVSLWITDAPYREARFGLDWTSWLLMRFGHGHWCLTVDADELLMFAHMDRRSLRDLTGWLDQEQRAAFGALMLDLYPDKPLGTFREDTGDPTEYLGWFDPSGYRTVRQSPMRNLWVQGGPRDRVFFTNAPEQAPTLNKLPLVKWSRRYAYVNSTHAMLPSRFNMLYDGPGGDEPSGVLLHTKFLPEVLEKSREDLKRKQHFHDPEKFSGYYDLIGHAPTLWHDGSERLKDWTQLAALNLINPGGFQ